MVGAPDVAQPWMPRAARDSDAWLCHVSIAGGARRRGCAAGGVSVFVNRLLAQGVVVESVNVRVFAYVPVRNASLAPIDCLNAIVTASLEVGADQLFSSVGADEPPTGANAVPTADCSV